MCGRFNIISDPMTQLIMDIIDGSFDDVTEQLEAIETRFNIAPTEQVEVLLKTEDGAWALTNMRWWLVPGWSSGPSTKYNMFNARSEGLSQSRAFSTSFKRRRCIIPVSGYFEWQKDGSRKIPHYIKPLDKPGFAFAGLWDVWQDGDQRIESCTIVTGPAPQNMKVLHHRVPIHLNKDQIETWLDPKQNTNQLQQILGDASPMALEVYPVSSYVGNSRHKDERCIEPLGERLVIH